MADRVKESGSWAQSEVIQTLQDNGVLPSHANEAIALADVIGSTAKSYAENTELVEELKGKKQLTFKIFKNGVFAPVSVLVDYSNGSNVEKAIAKAIASVATAEMVGLAAGALLNPATAPFAIAIGTVAAGYFAAGFVANKIGKAYDVWIGPDVESKGYDSNGYRQLESNYSVKDTLLLEEYHQNISIYEDENYMLKGDRDGVVLTHTIQNDKSSYKLNLTKDSADSKGYIEALVLYKPFSDITLETTTGTYQITNLLKKTKGQIASLAKSDPAVMFALEHLKSYAISGDSASSVDFTDAYIKDKAQMLYWHNVEKTRGKETVDAQLRNSNTHYSDMVSGTEIGEGYFDIDYDKKIIFGTNQSNTINGADESDRIYGMGGADFIQGGEGSDYIEGGSGNDNIHGDEGADEIHGREGNDRIIGGSLFLNDKQNYGDRLYGDGGDDYIEGGSGNDILIGGKDKDTLIGGSGFDTYIVNGGDIIDDSDAKGNIIFNSIDLTGTKTLLAGMDDMYEDDDFVYQERDGDLIVTHKQGEGAITIKNWNSEKKEGLGIKLGDDKDIEISTTEKVTASEGDSGTQKLTFTVTLSRELKDGESLEIEVPGTKEKTYTFKSGDKTKTFTHTWSGDTTDEGTIDHRATFTPKVVKYTGIEDAKVTVKNSTKATIYDDDDENRYDPLVLDTNKDGFISTSSLDDSNTYFDITGDGLRERIGWIKSEDALVAYDKNDNNQIDGIDEVFGNLSESGFEEIKRLIEVSNNISYKKIEAV